MSFIFVRGIPVEPTVICERPQKTSIRGLSPDLIGSDATSTFKPSIAGNHHPVCPYLCKTLGLTRASVLVVLQDHGAVGGRPTWQILPLWKRQNRRDRRDARRPDIACGMAPIGQGSL